MGNNADEHMDSALVAAGLEPGDRFAADVASSLRGEPAPERPPSRWRRRARRWGFNIITAPLYAVQVLWDRRVDVALVLCVTAWVGYWATAWVFLIIDRMGY